MINNQTKKHPLWIHGHSGKMGQCLDNLLTKSSSQSKFHFCGGSSKETPFSTQEGFTSCEGVIDFSSKEGHEQLLVDLNKKETSCLKWITVCTTGLNKETENDWLELSATKKLAFLIAPNTSLGIYLTRKAALAIAPSLKQRGFDIEIEESHHRYKKDAPSGTALLLAESLAKQNDLTLATSRSQERAPNELGIQATRGGGVFGEHTIRFLGDYEEVSITHRAFSREVFAQGALDLSLWLREQKPGVYSLDDIPL